MFMFMFIFIQELDNRELAVDSTEGYLLKGGYSLHGVPFRQNIHELLAQECAVRTDPTCPTCDANEII